MKFKQLLALVADADGSIPTARLRFVIRSNPRHTAREEAIAAEVLRQANPRENITGHYPWGPEQSLVLQQLWITHDQQQEWRDVPTANADHLFSTVQTKHGSLPIPNSILEPGQIRADFQQRLHDVLGADYLEDE